MQERYSRQTKLNQIGKRGQNLLLTSSVLIIGAGGLGCPVAQYLTGAGVGKIGVVDGDTVDLTNLHRQVLYTEEDCGSPKASKAIKHLKKLNSNTQFIAYDQFLDNQLGQTIFPEYDLIIDCTDNIPARLMINDLCCQLNKTWVYGGVRQFEGQVTVFNFEGGPSYRCLFPNHSPEQSSCAEDGVLGTVPGIIGLLMSNEAVKVITEASAILSGKLMVLNMLDNDIKHFNITRNQNNFKTNYKNEISSISVTELAHVLEKKQYTVVDVREDHEVAICQLENALHIPLSKLKDSLNTIPRELPIVAYCHHGIRSMSALQILQSNGFENLFNLTGGIDQWSLKVDHSITRY